MGRVCIYCGNHHIFLFFVIIRASRAARRSASFTRGGCGVGLAGRIACEYGGLTGFGLGHADVCMCVCLRVVCYFQTKKFATVAFFIPCNHQFMLLDGALGGNTA